MTHSLPPSSGRLRWSGAAAAFMILPAVLAPPSAYPLGVTAALVLAASILPWPFHRVALDRAACAVAALSLLVDVLHFGKPGLALLWLPFELAALLVLLVRVIRQVPAPRVLAVSGLTGAAALLLPLRFTLHEPNSGLKESVFVAALCLFPVACATGVGLYLRALDNRRVRAVGQARRQQRLEVAGALHDFVAHEVTGIVLEAQANQLGKLTSQDYVEVLARIEQAGMRALTSMDQTVAALRTANDEHGEPPSTRLHGLADLPELVGRYRAMSPADVVLMMPDAPLAALSREAEDTAYRVVLEALTNVRRHAAHATRVEVLARSTDAGAVDVRVTDDAGGGAANGGRQGGGTGLAGLAERVSALGGSLRAGPYEEGWQVACWLPTARPHHDGAR